MSLDERDFTQLPRTFKRAAARMAFLHLPQDAQAQWVEANWWDNEQLREAVIREAVAIRRARGWFVFSVTTPPSSFRACKRARIDHGAHLPVQVLFQ